MTCLIGENASLMILWHVDLLKIPLMILTGLVHTLVLAVAELVQLMITLMELHLVSTIFYLSYQYYFNWEFLI